MKALFDQISQASSRTITRAYSTSFSLGIRCFKREMQKAIYNIYGFVRLADEIVDSFHNYDKRTLLSEFRKDTFLAISRGISLNPVLNSFQETVNRYRIGHDLIECFMDSMEMDLEIRQYNERSLGQYILGSAEVVGLMCLRVFVNGDEAMYQRLRPAAMKLGSAFQKVNFLRDMKDDREILGRVYFPGLYTKGFTEASRKEIESGIDRDFDDALHGIRELPAGARFGVYIAYVYYRKLFNKIRSVSSQGIAQQRVRIPDYQKLNLLAYCYLKYNLRML